MALKFTTKSTKQPNRTICFRAGRKRFSCVFHLSLKIVLNLSTNLASRGRVKAFCPRFISAFCFAHSVFDLYAFRGKYQPKWHSHRNDKSEAKRKTKTVNRLPSLRLNISYNTLYYSLIERRFSFSVKKNKRFFILGFIKYNRFSRDPTSVSENFGYN